MIYLAEKTLKELEIKAKDEFKTPVKEKVKALKDILDSATKEELDTKTGELSDVVQKLSASVSQNNQPASETPTTDEKKPEDKGKKVEEGEVVS
jgi:non-homologous end joining protein Ku